MSLQINQEVYLVAPEWSAQDKLRRMMTGQVLDISEKFVYVVIGGSVIVFTKDGLVCVDTFSVIEYVIYNDKEDLINQLQKEISIEEDKNRLMNEIMDLLDNQQYVLDEDRLPHEKIKEVATILGID